MSEAASADIMGEVEENTSTSLILKRSSVDTLNFNSPDRVDGLRISSTWPSRVYLQTPPLPRRAINVAITVTAKDQGWGNTDHSYVAIRTINGAGDVDEVRLFNTVHQPREVSWSAIGVSHRDYLKGHAFQVVSLSAPYPGFQNVMLAARIEIHYSDDRYQLAVIRAQMARKPTNIFDSIRCDDDHDASSPLTQSIVERIHSIFSFSNSQQNPEPPLWDRASLRALEFMLVKCDDLVFSRIASFMYP
jgi:hypothetical protein